MRGDDPDGFERERRVAPLLAIALALATLACVAVVVHLVLGPA